MLLYIKEVGKLLQYKRNKSCFFFFYLCMVRDHPTPSLMNYFPLTAQPVSYSVFISLSVLFSQLRPTSIEKEIFPVMAEGGQLYAMELQGT